MGHKGFLLVVEKTPVVYLRSAREKDGAVNLQTRRGTAKFEKVLLIPHDPFGIDAREKDGAANLLLSANKQISSDITGNLSWRGC